MFQERAAEPTARYFRLSFTLIRILAVDLWSTLGLLLTGLVFLLFDELRVAGVIMSIIGGVLFLAETLFTHWFAGQAAKNLGYTLGSDELVVESGVFVRRKAKIPFTRIQDVTRTQGPIERMYGISTLLVQTAGQSGATGPEGRLRGIVDADEMAEIIMSAVKRGR